MRQRQDGQAFKVGNNESKGVGGGESQGGLRRVRPLVYAVHGMGC